MSHPKSGFYERDNLEYVSVSSVLGRTAELFNPNKQKGLEIWRQMQPDWEDIVARACRRGTIIHSEVELFFFGDTRKDRLKEATMDEIMQYNIYEYLTHLSPLLDLIKKENLCGSELEKSFLVEEELFCEHGYAGTPDIRLYWNGQYSVWDWKTVRSYKEEGVSKKAKSMSHYKEAFIQTGGYALAHNIAVRNGELDNEITQAVICVCYDWREPHVHVLDKRELRAAALEFTERYAAYCSLENTSFPRATQVAI